jgi:autotransporter translocation and assembly factor TamB
VRRWALRLLVAALLAVVALFPLVTRVPAGEAWVRARIVAFLEQRVTGTVTLGRVRGVPPRTLVLEDLRITVDGRPVVVLPTAEIHLAPWALLIGRVRVKHLVLRGLRVRAVEDVRGWHVPTARPVPPLTITVDLAHLDVTDARIEVAVPGPGGAVRHVALEDVRFAAHALLTPAHRTVTVDSFHAHPRGLPLGDVELSGGGSYIPGSGIDLDRVTLRTPRSQATVTGRVDPGRFAEGHLVLAPLAVHDVHAVWPGAPLLVDVSATVNAGGAWNALPVTATVDLGPGGTVVGSGRVDLSAPEVRYAGRAKFDALDPGAATPALPTATARGEVRVRGRGPAATVGVALRDSTVGRLPVVAARVLARTRGGVHRAHGFVVSTEGAAVGRTALVTRGTPTYRATGRVALDDLAALGAGVGGEAGVRVALRGRGLAPDARRATLDATLLRAVVEGARLDGGTLHATVDGARTTVDALGLSGPGIHAEGHAAIDGGRRTLQAMLDASTDLAVATRGAATPVGGAVTVHATLAGTPDAPVVTVQVGGTDVTSPHATVQDLRVEVRGTVAGPSAGGTGTVAARSITVLKGSAPEASAALVWRPVAGGVSVTLNALSLTPAEMEPWRLLRPTTVTVARAVQVESLVLHAGAQRIALDGRAQRLGPADVTLAVSDMALGPLCALADADPCGGTLGVEAHLSGTSGAPQLVVDAHVDRLSAADIAYGTFVGHVGYRDRTAAVHAMLHAPAAGQLLLDGTLPIDLAWDGSRRDLGGAPLALALHSDQLDLGFLVALAPGLVREPRGTLTADLRLAGSRAAPRLEGSARLAGGHIALTATGVTYDDVAAELTANTGAFTLRARTGDGTLAADGRLVLDGLRPGAVTATLRADKFEVVHQPATDVEVAGAWTLEGPLAAPVLSGDVRVTHAVVRPALMPSSGVHETRDPTIEVTGLPETPAPASAARGASLEWIGLSLAVHVESDAWIRRADADIALGGDVHVTRVPHEKLKVDGKIHLVRGWYDFQGRRFQIEGGSVTFTPGQPDPQLDVRATYRAPEYLVIVQVGGTLTAPSLALSSDPPLDQADVLALILFGKPVNALARGESLTLQRQAVSLGSGFVMPDLQNSVLSSLGLSTFDVQMPPDSQAGGSNATPGLVRVGSYVSNDLFVSLAQEFGARTGQVFGLEYALAPKVTLSVSTSTRGSNAIDAFWHHRY